MLLDNSLDWLVIERLDTLPEIRCFVEWTRRLGAGERDLGEASVFATAQLRQAIALCDDQEAVRVARSYDLEAHGTLWLLSRACRDGNLTEVNVANLIDALTQTGMRLPCTGSEYRAWARAHKLLAVNDGRWWPVSPLRRAASAVGSTRAALNSAEARPSGTGSGLPSQQVNRAALRTAAVPCAINYGGNHAATLGHNSDPLRNQVFRARSGTQLETACGRHSHRVLRTRQCRLGRHRRKGSALAQEADEALVSPSDRRRGHTRPVPLASRLASVRMG